MDIFKMANQIAKNMSLDEQNDLENMDMQDMISHVTKNVLGMMNNPNSPMANLVNNMQNMHGTIPGTPGTIPGTPGTIPGTPGTIPGTPGTIPGTPGIIPGTPGIISGMHGIIPGMHGMKLEQSDQIVETVNSDSEDDESNCIFPKTRDICFDLNVDLEDFYTGKKKKLNVKRKIIVEVDGKQTVVEEKKKIIIPIEKGMKDEQQIRFEGEADQIPGYKPGDIIITLIENEHPIFQRDGDNLIIIKNINLYQSYNYTFDIKHLDNIVYRVNNIPDEALHLNDSIRKLSNLGMPSYKSSGVYGDLFIRFNLVLPKMLNITQLEKLQEILKDDPLFLENNLDSKFDKNIILENLSDDDLEDLEDLYSDSDDETESESDEESGSEEHSSVSELSESSEEKVVKKKSLKKK
jgi:DnaJ-class molecular chaperone